MKTPRPHARTRRAAATLVCATAGLMFLAGCDPRTLIYFLQPFEPTIPPPCKVELKGKKVVIVAHALAGTQSDYQALDRQVAREVGRVFQEKVKKIELVSAEKTWKWIEDHPDWTDPTEVGKAFEADIVIFLEIETFQVGDPSSPDLLEGTAKTHIQAWEYGHPKNSKGKPILDQPKESSSIYDAYKDSVFPIRGPVPLGAGVSRASFRNKFLQVVSTEIAWHFIPHSPEDDIQDVKFSGY